MIDILDSEEKDIRLDFANQGKRFANLFIDLFVIAILKIAISAIFNLFEAGDLVDTIVLIMLMLFYYTFCEFFLGKTLGKLITKTIVLTDEGLKPNLTQCVQRSLSRLVLLEVFSYIAEHPIGWHDKWSKTRVMIDQRK